MGIHISKRAYNQLELFVNSFPSNCYGMNADYDRFLLKRCRHCPDVRDICAEICHKLPGQPSTSQGRRKREADDNSNFFV